MTATLPYTISAGGGAYHPPNWDTLLQTVTTYDELGRVVQVQAADGSVTRKDYQAWQELVLDAEGHQTAYQSDGLGRLTTVREYYGAYPAPDWNAAHPAVTTYHYDPQGNLTQVTDALGHVTRIGYDPLGRKTWMDDPSMGYWTYRYDNASNLIEQTDAENQTLTFAYDALKRLTHKYTLRITDYALLAEYGYDQGLNGIGRRTAMTDTSGVTTWQYDAQGRTLTETKTIAGAGTFATTWEYDAAGRVVTAAYPTGEAVRTTYNRRGLPETVIGLDDYLTNATYNAAGQPLRQTWGNTRQTSYAYEPDTLRLQHLQVSGGLLDLAYTYDDVGNIRTLTDASNAGQVQTFTYDARDRLLTAQTNAVGQGQYHETYGYDWLGNIITRTYGSETVAYTYGRRYGLTLPAPTTPVTNTYQIYLPLVARNHDPQRIEQPFAVVATSAGFRAGYDRNGNMLARVEVSGTETITYTQEWNVENRLSVVTNTVTGDVTRFVYDGDGARVLREAPGGLTAYVGAVEIAISGTQRVTTSYYFVGGQRVAMREGGTVTYLHGDHLGSASLATDDAGAQVNTLRYTPFGETRYGDALTDFCFTGQREEDFGWYDYGARFYSPGLGRFVSADTLIPEPGKPQGFNRYTYVSNNPLRYTDPTGHVMTEWDWQNRWYNAHGYFWDSGTGFWSTVGDPTFADVDIAREVIGEAGITLGGWESWSTDNIQKVAFGVARFGQKMGGGVPALKSLLGGGATIQLADPKTDFYCAGGQGDCAPPKLLRGGGSWVLLKKTNFDGMDLVGGGQRVVHELAHVIDWQNNFSKAWMDNHIPLTDYAATAPNYPIIARRKWEVWAEAVTVYIFGHYDVSGSYVSDYYRNQVDSRVPGSALTTQMSDMQAVLEGW